MSVVPTSSVTSMFLYGFDVYKWAVNGVVLGSDATATTYSLECGTQAISASTTQTNSTITRRMPTPQCSLPTSLHLTVGPNTMQYNATGRMDRFATSFTAPATTTANCTWSTVTPAPTATASVMGMCEDIISLTQDGIGLADGGWDGPVTFDPVTITGVVQAQVTPTATVTSKAGAPAAAVNGVTGMGGLLAVVAVLMGFL